MTQWREKIKFRDILEKYDEDKETISELSKKMHDRLLTYDSVKHLAILFSKRIKTEESFDDRLSVVYDYCDDNKIWVEF